MKQRKYFVYILTNKKNTVLYTGVTNNIERRIWEHKEKQISSFTAKYNINKIVYLEDYDDINEALQREKQIKAGSRANKIVLIKSINPEFRDLLEE